MPEIDDGYLLLEHILVPFCLVERMTTSQCYSLVEREVDGFCLGVCYRWSLLKNALSCLVPLVALVDFLDSTRHVLHVSGKDNNSEERNDNVLMMHSSEWTMILCNHHVILEEEVVEVEVVENSNDHDDTALNQSIFLCFHLLSLSGNDEVMENTVVET